MAENKCEERGYHRWTDKQGRIEGGSVGETFEDMDLEIKCLDCGHTASGNLTWDV
jgi:hypothetical protein